MPFCWLRIQFNPLEIRNNNNFMTDGSINYQYLGFEMWNLNNGPSSIIDKILELFYDTKESNVSNEVMNDKGNINV